jgi:hypothetical protein
MTLNGYERCLTVNLTDLMDRLEILYPGNSMIEELRNAYTSQEPFSMFELLKHIHNQHEDDAPLNLLRKAVMFKNRWALFQLIALQHQDQYNDLFLSTRLEKPRFDAMMRIVARGLPAGGDFALNIGKAIEHRDLFALFRVIDTENNNYLDLNLPDGLEHNDLKKFLLNDNKWSMWRVINYLQPTFLGKWMHAMAVDDIEWDGDCLSRGQLISKTWLIDELQKLDLDLGVVFLCAGWYGLLPAIMFERNLKIDKVRSFDIDPSVKEIALLANNPQVMDNWRFQAATADIHTLGYDDFEFEIIDDKGKMISQVETARTVINTSCEHIAEFDEWYAKIPDGKIVILQSNDFKEVKEHVNISRNLEQFAQQTPMTQVLYEGEKPTQKYTRFMRIGIK